ncbi:MAG: response regulator [Acidobacteria bacterium]|nr:MAG: response regulator [Acidobacteriota bacterium]
MSLSVLLIDDDPTIRETVEIILNHFGREVVCADSGPAGLDILRSGFKGVVLLDVMMPEMDGWETLKAMIEENTIEGCVVCMLTAVYNPDDKMEPVKDYVMDYLRKPFTAEELVATVDECIGYIAP